MNAVSNGPNREGSISPKLCGLTALLQLRLHNNQLDGECFAVIDFWHSRCTYTMRLSAVARWWTLSRCTTHSAESAIEIDAASFSVK